MDHQISLALTGKQIMPLLESRSHQSPQLGSIYCASIKVDKNNVQPGSVIAFSRVFTTGKPGLASFNSSDTIADGNVKAVIY